MQAASITVSTRADIKAQTKKIAKEQGLSVSGFINVLLQQVIGKKVIIKKISEKPTPYLKKILKESKKNRHLDSPTFQTGKEAVDWLEKQGI